MNDSLNFIDVRQLAKTILPVLWVACGIALAFWAFVAGPLSFIRQFRALPAMAASVVSYLLRAILLLVGIGALPVVLAVLAIRGEWSILAGLLFLILLAWYARTYADSFWQGEAKIAEINKEAIAAMRPPALVAPPNPAVIQRPACSKCGVTYNLDNSYSCGECETYFCYRCVWNLEKTGGSPDRWKCPCGGELA